MFYFSRLPDIEQLIQRGLKSRGDIAVFLLNAGILLVTGRLIWKREIFIFDEVAADFAIKAFAQMSFSCLGIYLLTRLAVAKRWPVHTWPYKAALLLVAAVYAFADNPFFLAPMIAAVVFSARIDPKPFANIALASAALGLVYMLSSPYGSAVNLVSYFVYSFVLTLFGSVFFYLMARLLLEKSEQNEKLQAALLKREEFRALELRNLALEERAHLSRELHDTLGHNLTVVRLQTQIAYKLAQKSGASDPKLLESLSDAVEHGKEALQRLQEVVSALRYSDPAGHLVDAMRQILGQWPGQVSFEVVGTEPALPHAHRLALLRAFQESLTNAYKYAYGEALTLRLVFEGAEGENASAPRAIFSASNSLRAGQAEQEFADEFSRGGRGLPGLRLRFDALGGEVQVERTEDVFRAVYILPLPAGGTTQVPVNSSHWPATPEPVATPPSSRMRGTP